ncbi:hypothetical protein ACH47B_26415 [Rhodococcus sp. NPDC019627]|uniref:hypothetical protein n=1 Tax=unclassified Rhodococcus (in: high G+C Gram-positive bacteria) TaxID=192944 RepID=UPI0033DED276
MTTTRKRIDRKKLHALTELGERRTALRAELAAVEDEIDTYLKPVFLEGWSWDQISEASGMSLQTVSNRLKKQGAMDGGQSSGRPLDQFSKAELRSKRAAEITAAKRRGKKKTGTPDTAAPHEIEATQVNHRTNRPAETMDTRAAMPPS